MASQVSWFWRDARMLPLLLVWVAFAGSLLIYFGGAILPQQASPTARAQGAQAVSDDELYTGSIIVVPRASDRCPRLMFNNRTGRLSEGGSIDCYAITKRDKGQGGMSYARMQALHEAFRR
jgi:hypothetical protein